MLKSNERRIEYTESELFNFYLKNGYDDIMSFIDFKRRCINIGLKIINKKE